MSVLSGSPAPHPWCCWHNKFDSHLNRGFDRSFDFGLLDCGLSCYVLYTQKDQSNRRLDLPFDVLWVYGFCHRAKLRFLNNKKNRQQPVFTLIFFSFPYKSQGQQCCRQQSNPKLHQEQSKLRYALEF